MLVRREDIGGGFVQRGFSRGATFLKVGSHLTRKELLSIPAVNLQSLVDNKYLNIYPPALLTAGGDYHVVNLGFGKFTVIHGRQMLDAPATKEEAEAFVAKQREAEAEELVASLPAELAPQGQEQPAEAPLVT